MRVWPGLLLILLSTVCQADIYLTTDKNGDQVYSDTPSTGAQKIVMPGIATPDSHTSVTTTTQRAAGVPAEKGIPLSSAAAVTGYDQFDMISPIDQQTITNQRDVTVELSIKPGLRKWDKIQLYVDGAAVGMPAATTHQTLHNLERGTHTLSAVLLDAGNNALKQTRAVTIFIHYAALGDAVPK